MIEMRRFDSAENIFIIPSIFMADPSAEKVIEVIETLTDIICELKEHLDSII